MFWSDEAWTLEFPPESQPLQMCMGGIDYVRNKTNLKFIANLARCV